MSAFKKAQGGAMNQAAVDSDAAARAKQDKERAMLDNALARDKYQQAFGAATTWGPNATAAHVGTQNINNVHADEARAYQAKNADMLAAIAYGGGGGQGEMAARANMQAANNATNAYAATRATPGNAAMTARMAGNTTAATGATGEARIAALKAQEQLAAQAALGNTTAAMRAQDFGLASEQAKFAQQSNLANAGFGQQTALANQDAWNKQQALKRAAFGAMTGHDQGVFDDATARFKKQMGFTEWDRDISRQQQARSDARTAQYVNTGAAVVKYGADAYGSDGKTNASDKRIKTDIKSGDAELRRRLDALLGGE